MNLKVWIRLVRILAVKIIKFFTHDIWNLDVDDFSRWKKWGISLYTILAASMKDFADKKIGIMSASLSYFCTVAFVPFLAVCFALTDGFGLGEVVNSILNDNISDPQLVSVLKGAADNIIASAQAGGFGLVNALAFIWLVIWMMMRVEKVFNDVWMVPEAAVEERRKSRNFFKSLGVDLMILLFSPFLIIFFFVGTIGYAKLFDNVIPNYSIVFEEVKSFLGWAIFAAVVILIFSAMYKFIPTARVKYKFALKAAIIAGLAFTVLQYLYLETQLLVTRINAVYGAVAAIPLFLMWMRFGWLITMLGAQFSFSFQNPGLIKAKARQ